MRFGFGKREISGCYEPGMAMMGWGMRYNQVQGVAAPLFVRAVVLVDESTQQRLAWCTFDTLLITQGLWFGVVDQLAQTDLGFDASNTVLTATHTHSGPSGFGHHFWTNLNAPGWSETVYSGLCAAAVGAIRDAFSALQNGDLHFDRAEVSVDAGIAFNRSWFAYNQNDDVEPVTYENRAEAADRLSSAVVFRDDAGAVAGVWNWLGTHGTCVHADNTLMHPDHKGLAALALESQGLGVVMAQECCGDVSPNYRWDKRRKHTIGRYDDDLRSASHVADVQAATIGKLIEGEPDEERPWNLHVSSAYVDFSCASVDARFTPDKRRRTTSPARLGLSMAEGTAEGPGPLRKARWITRGGAAIRQRWQRLGRKDVDPKIPFIDLAAGSAGRMLGLLPVHKMPGLDETLGWVGNAVRSGGVHEGSWIPQTVAMHLITLGPVAILAVPFEMTTVAGRRLRRTLLDALRNRGVDVDYAVISTYANAYVGYLTTFEEYQVQHYEAGYTLFGPHTLGALQTAVARLAGRCTDSPPKIHGEAPWRPPKELLERLRFETPWTTR